MSTKSRRHEDYAVVWTCALDQVPETGLKAQGSTLTPDQRSSADEAKANLPAVLETTSEKAICAFGPKSSFFCYGGDKRVSWKYFNVDSDGLSTISTADLSKWSIFAPHQVALSPHGAGYFAYNTYGDGLMWRFVSINLATRPRRRKAKKCFDEVVQAYERLKCWLVTNVVSAEDIETTRVVFGPGARYMAWKSDGIWIHNDLPSDFFSELKIRGTAKEQKILPAHLTFGLGNSWGVIWPDRSHSLSLDGRFQELDRRLMDQANYRLLNIALSNYGSSQAFYVSVTSQTGHLRYMITGRRKENATERWDAQALQWSAKLKKNLTITSEDGAKCSRLLVAPTDLNTSTLVQKAAHAEESERLAKQAALLSIESSKKSTKAAEISLIAGTVAVLAGCSIM